MLAELCLRGAKCGADRCSMACVDQRRRDGSKWGGAHSFAGVRERPRRRLHVCAAGHQRSEVDELRAKRGLGAEGEQANGNDVEVVSDGASDPRKQTQEENHEVEKGALVLVKSCRLLNPR